MTESQTRLPLSRYPSTPALAAQAKLWAQQGEIVGVLDAVSQVVLVLNDDRQIVHANAAALQVTGAASADELVGMRPGDSLACERALQAPGGCGTAEGCAACGAFRSISAALDGRPCDHDCRLLQYGTARALQFRVSTRRTTVGGQQFSILTLTDISHEHRRRSLERIFFHDLLNTVGAMSGYLELLDSVPENERPQMSQSLLRLVDTLVDEIRSQRDLVLAENGELPVRPTDVLSLDIFRHVITSYRNQPLAAGKFLFVGEGSQNLAINTDRGLLIRVLGNLVKNALEASVSGDHVLLGCEASDSGGVSFWVQNRAAMPREVQLQMFQRAFSTKGTGRGLGTYGVKLLTTRYLKGEVAFSSSPESGTRFVITLPAALAPKAASSPAALVSHAR